MDATDLKSFCVALPKVELHAHLNTSYSIECLKELVALNGQKEHQNVDNLCILSQSEFDESFNLFKKIQQLVTTEDAVYTLTRMVILEFVKDNVKYLEIRSTPKQIDATGMTRELYMRTMIRAVKDCERDGTDIVVKLLPSIDRRLGVKVAVDTVNLAYELMKESDSVVVGIDFSGDPRVGNAEDYIPVFLDAAKKGLKLALHMEEIELHEETEKVLEALSGYLDTVRIGHGTFLHRSNQGNGHNKVEQIVTENKIPIEVCITSNLKTKSIDCVEESQFQYWFKRNHPTMLCTDGKGAFVVNLSDEYMKAAKGFQLSKKELKQISLDSINSIFACQTVKRSLIDTINQFDTSIY